MRPGPSARQAPLPHARTHPTAIAAGRAVATERRVPRGRGGRLLISVPVLGHPLLADPVQETVATRLLLPHVPVGFQNAAPAVDQR